MVSIRWREWGRNGAGFGYGVLALFFGWTLPVLAEVTEAVRPNILWLDAEDANVNWIGAYGNPAATTPNIDQLAAEGFLYSHAFANAPVCAPSRSTWITGVHAVSMGTHPMRSQNRIPHETIRYYPDYLRAAGYYATQPGKTDYNIGGRPDKQAWNPGDWRRRGDGQPFFHVAHFFQSHESQAFGAVDNTRHDPVFQRLRAYHPDLTQIRNNYAHYADAVERMDAAIGRTLAQLEEAGLAENTIVIFTTDHGGVMPGSKRFLTDSGTHAPFIIRIPEKFKHLWPTEKPGAIVDRLVSFVDMPKTWLSLAGAEVPDTMQGRIFLGPDQEPEREFHFAFRGRMDERFDQVRAVREKRFLYIKNYMPYVPAGQRLDYLWRMEATQAWVKHHEAGLTDDVTGRFFRPRPVVEELYDTVRDPDNVINLAGRAEHQADLERMRRALREWQLEVHDAGMLSEEAMLRRAARHDTTIYEMVRDPDVYNLPAYLDAADVALAMDSENLEILIRFLDHADAGIRYWGTAGLLMLESANPEVVLALKSQLQDEAHDVRAMAAWGLIRTGKELDAARACLIELLETDSYASLLALNIIELTNDDLSNYLPALREVKDGTGGYSGRMRDYLLALADK